MDYIILHAYDKEFGFVETFHDCYNFVTLKQCHKILTVLYEQYPKLESCVLLGHGKYEGTSITNPIEEVIRSLDPNKELAI